MGFASVQLDMSIGQEELLSLGDFIEKETREYLKKVWRQGLVVVLDRLGLSRFHVKPEYIL